MFECLRMHARRRAHALTCGLAGEQIHAHKYQCEVKCFHHKKSQIANMGQWNLISCCHDYWCPISNITRWTVDHNQLDCTVRRWVNNTSTWWGQLNSTLDLKGVLPTAWTQALSARKCLAESYRQAQRTCTQVSFSSKSSHSYNTQRPILNLMACYCLKTWHFVPGCLLSARTHPPTDISLTEFPKYARISQHSKHIGHQNNWKQFQLMEWLLGLSIKLS